MRKSKDARELCWAALIGIMVVSIAIMIWSWIFTIQQAEQWHDRQHAEDQHER